MAQPGASDPQVSAVHARIRNMEGRWIIYDEDSATGTYVNRRRVRVAELRDGDEILIGTNKVSLDGLSVKGFVGREGDIRAPRGARGSRSLVGGIPGLPCVPYQCCPPSGGAPYGWARGSADHRRATGGHRCDSGQPATTAFLAHPTLCGGIEARHSESGPVVGAGPGDRSRPPHYLPSRHLRCHGGGRR